jgi:ATP-dependent DNA helicase RecG
MQNAPGPTQRREAAAWLLKPLLLEARQGCRDTAVSGGLDKWVPRVREKLMAQAGFEAAAAADLLAPLAGYGAATPAAREGLLSEVHARLARLGAPAPSAPPTPEAPPTKPRKRAPVKTAESPALKPGPEPRTEPVEISDYRLDTPVQYLKGVGPVRARLLRKLGVETAEDLLRYFPRDWQDRRRLARVAELTPGETATVAGVVKLRTTVYLRRGLKLTKVVIDDGTGLLTGTWFNQPFMKDRFAEGQRVLFYGKVEPYRGFQIANPDYEVLGDGEEDQVHTGRIVPVYALTERLSQRVLRGIVHAQLARLPRDWPEVLPPALAAGRGFPPPAEALAQVHFPETYETLDRARRRLIFEELFLQQLAMLRLKRHYREDPGQPLPGDGPRLRAFEAGLPFVLTRAQQQARTELLQDLAQPRPMHRLLQGEVGSGKTVVAAYALLAAVDAGAQAAIMAPTEILAAQHFQTLQALLAPCRTTLALFTSGTPARERRVQERALAAGEVQIAVGTHALLEERIAFQRLAVAVVDEQHRFGVEQRARLRAKGEFPHVLVMTATPIPRTLALTAFGDLDVTSLNEVPPGRLPVRTEWLSQAAVGKAYVRAREELEAGRQVYIIFPLVSESEKLALKAVTGEYDRLAREVFPGRTLGLMHGQMPSEDKEAIMAGFKANRIQVLVSTSVVEVGVDVPNATVMIVENAERFGLAQLHQLRGRVGRGAHSSVCFLVGDPNTPEGAARLQTLTRVADGFRLAEEDLRQRGPGEFLGLRQSGLPDLRLADLVRDAAEIESARRAAADLLRADPELAGPEYGELRRLYTRIYGAREERLLAG